MDIFESIDKVTDGGKKRLSIEYIYQKKTQVEHILLRPDTYIGSVEFTEKTVTQNIVWLLVSNQNLADVGVR